MFSDFLIEINLSKILIRNPLIVASERKITEAIALMSAGRTSCSLTCEIDLKQSQLFTEAQSSCVLVVENNQLVGILTEQDLVRLVATKEQLFTKIAIAEVISHPVVTLPESQSTDLLTILNLFQKHQIQHLPIVDEQEKVVGILTHKSLLQLFGSIDWLHLRQVTEVMTTDLVYAKPTTSVAQLTQLMADHQVSSVVIVEESESKETQNLGIVTERDLVQLLALELNLAQVQAQQIMSSSVFSVQPDVTLDSVWMLMQQQHSDRILIKDHHNSLLGMVTPTNLLEVFNPVQIYRLVDKLAKQVSRLEAEKLELLKSRTLELEQQVQERTAELQAQYQKERLLANITSQIRDSLNLQDVLNTTVATVRLFLHCDRVLLYQFDSDWVGKVVVESVSSKELSIIRLVAK